MPEIDVEAFFAARKQVEADCRAKAVEIKQVIDTAVANTLYPDGMPPALTSLSQIITHYISVTAAPEQEPAPPAE